MKRKIFIGAAWPYANNSLHLGHVAALLPADIIARYHRLKGDEVLYVSGSDCHGTPIIVSAEKEGVSPEEIAQKYHREFINTLVKGVNCSYDTFATTLTKNHKEVVQKIFLKLKDKGYIYEKEQKLPHCETCKRFLPDRYIEGECPTCHFKDARGDQCDNCGTLLDPEQLINPRCKICSTAPVWKQSKHFFLKLSTLAPKLKVWVKKAKGWRANALNFTKKFLETGLQDRAVTRDIEWGVAIPLPGYESKKIYVWFDAVCGYLSASKEWAKNGNKWKGFWQDENAIHYYVHGKDNIPFHTIIWPAMLIGVGGIHLPDAIVSSEYLTLEKEQFSKSRNWAVWLPDFLSRYEADALRYYLVANGPETSDADFSWNEFQARVNKELIGNFGNFIHRTLTLIEKHFPGGIEYAKNDKTKILKLAEEKFTLVGETIEKGRFREALKHVFELAEEGNRFLATAAPWQKIKSQKEEAAEDLWAAAATIHCIAVLIEPFLPKTSQKILKLLNVKSDKISWKPPEKTKYTIVSPTPLFVKIEDKQIEIEKQRLEAEVKNANI